jgi:hypothetical protein
MSTSASSSTSTAPGPSGQNPHALLQNNEEKNRSVYALCELLQTCFSVVVASCYQRGDQSRDGWRLTDRQDESHGQICRGKL